MAQKDVFVWDLSLTNLNKGTELVVFAYLTSSPNLPFPMEHTFGLSPKNVSSWFVNCMAIKLSLVSN